MDTINDTNLSWSEHVLNRLSNVLETHALLIDLSPTLNEGKHISFAKKFIVIHFILVSERGRHRRRGNQLLPMMLFGVTAMGVFLIPFGFQMLSILGGKALLLAKMALLLASMNGLKRVFFITNRDRGRDH